MLSSQLYQRYASSFQDRPLACNNNYVDFSISISLHASLTDLNLPLLLAMKTLFWLALCILSLFLKCSFVE